MAKRLTINMARLPRLISEAIEADKHNVFTIWGELGKGKTTLGLQLLYSVYHDWEKVLSHTFFTFYEVKDFLTNLVLNKKRCPMLLWDDLAVYFHRSLIQYMNPLVQEFFGRYNFIRPYLANLILTTPSVDFVPRQLLAFMTGDLWVQKRGKADFDRAIVVRNFRGRTRTRIKNYDGYDVTWKPVPLDVYSRYEKVRHEHAVEAFLNPRGTFVYAMPKKEDMLH